MDYALKTFDLSKQYKKKAVVNKVNMNICRGDIYGFVGENGSGKTTIIRLITGLISPNGGSFELFGTTNTSPEIYSARKKIGAIVEAPSIYQNMSASDNLRMQCRLMGINSEEKIISTLKEVGLEAVINDKKHASDFSLGMRQRLGIAMALLGDPEFIILDEPMNGLDPAGIVEIRELILKLNGEKNITFLISSHILTELSLVATKYGIISHGQIIREITAAELRAECGRITDIVAADQEKLMRLLRQSFDESRLSYRPEGVRINGDVNLHSILCEIISSGNEILSVKCSETSIEDYYLSLLGGAKHD